MRMAAFLLVLAVPTAASADDFCSDRPGLATGTCIVPPSRLQLESSLASWSLDRRNGVRSTELAIGSTTLRLGVAPGLEVRAGFDPFVRQHERGPAGSDRVSGTGDLTLGIKQRLTAADASFSVDLLPLLKLPVARRPIGNGGLEGALLVPAGFDLSDTLSVTLTSEADWLADDDGHGHHAGLAVAVSFGAALGSRLSAALDVTASRNFDPAGHSSAQEAGVSFAWMARPNLQFDAEADTGLGGDASDLTLTAGFAYRP